MANPAWLRRVLPAYYFLGFLFALAVGGMGLADYYNTKTTRMYDWRGILFIETILMFLGFLLSLVALYRFKSFNEWFQGSKDEGSKSCRAEWLANQVTFFLVFTFLGLIGLVQIFFLYDYTHNEDGWQTAINTGFPMGTGQWSYAVQHKHDFLLTLQLQFGLAFVIPIAGVARCMQRNALSGGK